MKTARKFMAYITVFAMIFTSSIYSFAEDSDEISIEFSSNQVSINGNTDGITVQTDENGTGVIISEKGTYTFSGSCSNGYVLFEKDASGSEITLDGISLKSSYTAPLNIKGDADITVKKGSENTLEDVDRSAEKPKSVLNISGSAEIGGKGILNINGKNKNGIKADENLSIGSNVTINVDAVDNGIAADNLLTVNGTLDISAGGDGLSSKPDTDEEGNLLADGNIVIEGGKINITSTGDCIQADNILTVNDGSLTLISNGGSTTKLSDDADSCKGIKGSAKLVINGGTFDIDAADDAVHSDNFIYVNGGNFNIKTGDDGMHADSQLYVGSKTGGCPVINVEKCYEGLEASDLYIYSGDIDIVSSDDGLNAAGGNDSSGGTDFRRMQESSGEYSINISAGDIYINAEGDGIDSNGDINISGGRTVVFGQEAGRDNSALDYGNKCHVTGGILFAAGGKGMGSIGPSSDSQSYVTYSGTVTAGTVINVSRKGTPCFSVESPKKVVNIIYSDSEGETSSDYTVSTGSSKEFTCSHNKTALLNKIEATCECGYTGDKYCADCGEFIEAGEITEPVSEHSWDGGITENGITTYTCEVCGETKEVSTPYTAQFEKESGVTVNIFYTQSIDSISEENVSSAVARNSETGEIDTTGEGQINFSISLPEGYDLSDIEIEGEYKNLKDLGNGYYRITKITSDLNISIKVASHEHSFSEWVCEKEASASSNGKMTRYCTECNKKEEKVIAAISKTTLSAESFTYSGKAKKPSVTVKDSSGNTISKSYYDISYVGNTNVGSAKVKIKFKGKYTGEIVKKFTIKPGKSVLSSAKAGKGKITVKAASAVKNTGGNRYKIAYKKQGTDTWKYVSSRTASKTIKNLKKGKKYQVKIRAYRKVGNTVYYGEWSKVKTTGKVK